MEIAETPSAIHIRHSKNPGGPSLALARTRFTAFVSIPLAQFAGQVTLVQLYAVAFLVAAFQVVGSNASIS